jgi:hypothetical protein
VSAYIGYYRPAQSFLEANQAKARDQGAFAVEPKMQQKVRELPEKLPSGCKILGAFAPIQSGAVIGDNALPGVLVIDTENSADLTFINQHYAGYLIFQWTPANVVGTNRAEREAMQAQQLARTPATV